MRNEIELPTVKRYRPYGISDYYGAGQAAARYGGLRRRYPFRRVVWQHGWIMPERNSIVSIAGQPIPKDIGRMLVARKEEADTLILNGYQAFAIGLPYVYVRALQACDRSSRIPDSVLVMPRHLVRQMTKWKENDELRDMVFSLESKCISVCLHGDDFLLGRSKCWGGSGVRLITGAIPDDKNALLRMHALFSSYDILLTDSIGSHVAYGAASGMRIAVMPYQDHPEDWSTIPYYRDRPEHAQFEIATAKRLLDSQHSPYRFLFSAPHSSKTHEEWGLKQIGADNQVSGTRLKELLGWTTPKRQIALARWHTSRLLSTLGWQKVFRKRASLEL